MTLLKYKGEKSMEYENIEAFVVIAMAIMLLSALVDFVHKNSENKKIISDLEGVFKNNKDVISIGKYIEVLNNEIHNRRFELEDIEEELQSKHTEVESLENKISFLQQNPELQNAAHVKVQLSKLEDLKSTLKKLNSTQAHRFQVSLLIELIKELYFDLYGKDITIKEIEEIMKDYGSGSNGGSSFEGLPKKENPKESLRNKIKGPSL